MGGGDYSRKPHDCRCRIGSRGEISGGSAMAPSCNPRRARPSRSTGSGRRVRAPAHITADEVLLVFVGGGLCVVPGQGRLPFQGKNPRLHHKPDGAA